MAAQNIRSPDKIIDAIRTGTATKGEIAAAWASFQGFIRKLANYYKGALRTSGEIDDLVSESFFAFVDAAKSYDRNKGPFLPWFSIHLHRSFQEYVAVNSGRSRRDQALLHAISSFIAEYERDHGQRPALHRISEALKIPEKTIETVMTVDRIGSLEDPTGEDLTLADTIPDPNCLEDDVIEKMMREEISKALTEELNSLPADERKVIYGLYVRGFTYEQTAAYCGRTVSEIKMSRNRAMRKLRAKRVKDKLRRILPDSIGSLAYRGTAFRFKYGGSVTEAAAIKMMGEERNDKNRI